jgi:hypothetical protein
VGSCELLDSIKQGPTFLHATNEPKYQHPVMKTKSRGVGYSMLLPPRAQVGLGRLNYS